MASVSAKQLKNRIRSMRATRQITKAMEMVASSKLRKAQEQAIAAKPYFETLCSVLENIAGTNKGLRSPYTKVSAGEKTLYVVIAGDRGLAGGYNNNILKLVRSRIGDSGSYILPVGKKAEEFFWNNRVANADIQYSPAAEITIGDCFTLSKQICKRLYDGKYDRVCVAYTEFVSVLSQQPQIRQILPLEQPQMIHKAGQAVLYEPNIEEVFETIIPEYVGGVLYGALCESRASEYAARRIAMDAATKNADEMITDLGLMYNRVRQGAITQEITEMIAGVERS